MSHPRSNPRKARSTRFTGNYSETPRGDAASHTQRSLQIAQRSASDNEKSNDVTDGMTGSGNSLSEHVTPSRRPTRPEIPVHQHSVRYILDGDVTSGISSPAHVGLHAGDGSFKHGASGGMSAQSTKQSTAAHGDVPHHIRRDGNNEGLRKRHPLDRERRTRAADEGVSPLVRAEDDQNALGPVPPQKNPQTTTRDAATGSTQSVRPKDVDVLPDNKTVKDGGGNLWMGLRTFAKTHWPLIIACALIVLILGLVIFARRPTQATRHGKVSSPHNNRALEYDWEDPYAALFNNEEDDV